ncbi:uncharacterized protein [Chiloscyllium punctatum]|uniref:uncharacterized protein isoform X1 n=1 Tax=Chiloscyllium punctatum TaxID=137246 RepID=UPI003B6406B2
MVGQPERQSQGGQESSINPVARFLSVLFILLVSCGVGSNSTQFHPQMPQGKTTERGHATNQRTSHTTIHQEQFGTGSQTTAITGTHNSTQTNSHAQTTTHQDDGPDTQHEQNQCSVKNPMQGLHRTHYIGQTGRQLTIRIHEHQLTMKQHDQLSLVATHTDDKQREFDWDNTTIIGQAKQRTAREFLEAWHLSTDSINKYIVLDPIYRPLQRTARTDNRKRQRQATINAGGNITEALHRRIPEDVT